MNRTVAELGHLGHCRWLGRAKAIAAGLAAVLEGCDIAAAAPEGVALLPADAVPHGAVVVPHPFAYREGLALVRFPGAAADGNGDGGAIGSAAGSAAAPAGLAGAPAAALAAVRLGVLEAALDAALERLAARRFGGVPLIDLQLVSGAIADATTEIELAAASIGPADSVDAAWHRHERLTEAGWTVARLFGGQGYLVEHPARGLHLSALAADVWLARPRTAEEAC